MSLRSAFAVLLLTCCVSCGGDSGTSPSETPTPAATTPPAGDTSPWATTPDVETLLGQMTQAERGSVVNSHEVATYLLG